MGRFDTDPRYDVNPVAVTVWPSTNSSTNACLPAHHVSAQESMPSLQPSTCLVSDGTGWQNMPALEFVTALTIRDVIIPIWCNHFRMECRWYTCVNIESDMV